MARGKLRVLLGAAPGVGKTYTMLEEGARLLAEGKDVVIAVVETHGRKATAAMTRGFEVVPRIALKHRGVTLEEMNVDAVIARAPQIALVDELAHTNAPGSRHTKRWEDVEQLLDAGIDVISTVNIQHIESMNDVVEQITHIKQRETIPDDVLRQADQVEVIDIAPQALRDRLSAGLVYPAERIDAALSNYFRLGNLTALRELALLWLADEVDSALTNYRAEHGIDKTWEARERIVVALPGGPEGETLLRRGARIAQRTKGGELLAVHVVSQDGLRNARPAEIAKQQVLVQQLGGTYHQIIGDDVPLSIIEFAKAVNATQVLIGASRRSLLSRLLTGQGSGSLVIRESGSIDVHIVTHAAAAKPLRLPKFGSPLSRRRRIGGWALALAGPPLMTWLLQNQVTQLSVTSNVLWFQSLVVVTALMGGMAPALFGAIASGLLLNYFFIDPLYTLTIAEPKNIFALILSVLVAVLVSIVVGRAARQTLISQRAMAEAEVLMAVAGNVVRGDDAIQAIIDRIYEAFSLRAVELCQGELVVASAGEVGTERHISAYPVGERAVLKLYGDDLHGSERRVLAALIVQLDAMFEYKELAQTASSIAPLEASEKIRSALLAALGHDLRRPLASATAAVGGIEMAGDALSERDRRELFRTANESLQALAKLINDLLDVSKLQEGMLKPALASVDIADVFVQALDEVKADPEVIRIEIDDTARPVRADAVLLQRVVVNLLINALRYSPAGKPIRLIASALGETGEIRVIDQGPGVSPERFEAIFSPFQRYGDTDNTTGLGLGLALSKGFVEGMGGRLEPETTPGGGMTMIVTLPLADTTVGVSAMTDDEEGTRA